jgi:hypothetical protein
MKLHLDMVGAGGTLFGALAAAPACCLPLLSAVGASLGLGALAPSFQGTLVYVLEVFVALAVVGAFIGFRAHRKWGPLAVAVASAAGIFYAFNVEPSQVLVFSSLGGLVAAAVWNTVEGRKCAACAPQPMQRQSTITCPSCGYQRTETMPTESCLFFYECPGCKVLLRPKPGDCCVFCSYGSVKCPPKQGEACAC